MQIPGGFSATIHLMGAKSTPLCFELLSEIGEGTFGKVYKAQERGRKHRLLAVKSLCFRGDWSSVGIPEVLIREVALMCRLSASHPNVVKLFHVTMVSTDRRLHLTLLLEYVDQSLSSFLSKVPASGLRRDTIKDIMQQLLKGLNFLQSNLLVHGDLKPENILLNRRGQVKIADFGLVPFYKYITQTPEMLTLWYKAPEVLLQSVYVPAVDMWSIGCILAELFLLRPLFRGNTVEEQLQKIFEVIGFPSKEDWPSDSSIPYSSRLRPERTEMLFALQIHEYHLLTECLTFSPGRRICTAKALSHSFFIYREDL